MSAKGEIVWIGDWDQARGPVGWGFRNCEVGLAVGNDGTIIVCGYSLEELRQIWELERAVEA